MYQMYDMPLYRPPSEARSLILQVTLGCSHNKCTFCYMYKTKKYREKSLEEIKQHIQMAKEYHPQAKRVFLADGNVLAMETEKLQTIITSVKSQFSKLERISAYAGPKDILAKSDSELGELKEAGLDMLYLGVESGSDRVLQDIKKGVTSQEMIEAGQKAIRAGFTLSCMIISGMGGQEHWQEHALESARVITAINPQYFAILTLLVEEGTPLERKVQSGEFKLLEPEQVLQEMKLMLEKTEVNDCLFRSNHPSNYLTLKGMLNTDREEMLKLIEATIARKGYRPEGWRAL